MNELTVKRLTTMENKVEYCLEHFPETRNSDLKLQIELCKKFYPRLESPIYSYDDLLKMMYVLPRLDHIARCRRRVIEKHKYAKYLPTRLEIALSRSILEKTWREYTGYKEVNNETNVPVGGEDIANGRV